MHSPQFSGALRYLVRSSDLEMKDCALGHGYARRQFVIDVKTVVDSNGDWGERWNARDQQHDNPGILVAEQTKYRNENMNLHTRTQAIALWRSHILVLEHWYSLLFDNCLC